MTEKVATEKDSPHGEDAISVTISGVTYSFSERLESSASLGDYGATRKIIETIQNFEIAKKANCAILESIDALIKDCSIDAVDELEIQDRTFETFFSEQSKLKRSFLDSYNVIFIKFLNTACKTELEKAKGIEAAHSSNIIKYRENNGAFKSIKDLEGIGAGLTPEQVEALMRTVIGDLFSAW